MSFGQKLRKLRKEKELTQAELAKILNLGESTISFYESGKREPDYEILTKIANYFECSTDYLLCRTDNPKGHLYEIERVEFPGIAEASGNVDINLYLGAIKAFVDEAVKDGVLLPEEVPEKLQFLQKMLEVQIEQAKAKRKGGKEKTTE